MIDLDLKPRLSEKTYGLGDRLNTYTFEVSSKANKHSVARQVASLYSVKVLGVRFASVPGKSTRNYRKRGRKFINSQRADIRKAYITLAKGDKLPIFAATDADKPKKPAVEKK
ncbi:MAG: 50S ribosomal protein L23 [Candidatus Saccharimonadales bacterium]